MLSLKYNLKVQCGVLFQTFGDLFPRHFVEFDIHESLLLRGSKGEKKKFLEVFEYSKLLVTTNYSYGRVFRVADSGGSCKCMQRFIDLESFLSSISSSIPLFSVTKKIKNKAESKQKLQSYYYWVLFYASSSILLFSVIIHKFTNCTAGYPVTKYIYPTRTLSLLRLSHSHNVERSH